LGGDKTLPKVKGGSWGTQAFWTAFLQSFLRGFLDFFVSI
jgi:hypothetical protein